MLDNDDEDTLTEICRHGAGDTSCSSHPDNVQQREYDYQAEQRKERDRTKAEEQELKRLRKVQEDLYAMTPDKEKYEIVDFKRIGSHLVMKVLYPNCSKCAYEGNKVMVFLNVAEADVIKWRVIDPHFRFIDASQRPPKEAPSPAARFPASKEGWSDACAYAEGKNKG